MRVVSGRSPWRGMSARIAIGLGALVLASCGGGGGGSADTSVKPQPVTPPASAPSPTVPAEPPIASAGPHLLALPNTKVILDGSASKDPAGKALTYRWTIVNWPSGTSAPEITDAQSVRASFVPKLAGQYVAQLAVDNGLSVASAQTLVTTNTPPVAQARATGKVIAGQRLSFDGTASADADGDALSYVWTLKSVPPGSRAVLGQAGLPTVDLVPDVAGTYVVALVVNDGKTTSAPIEVTARSSTAPKAYYTYNLPLIPGETMTIDASGSSDEDGDPLSFKWAVLSGPSGTNAQFDATTGPRATLIASKAGLYRVRLEVSDGTSTDSLTFDVEVDNRPITRVKFPRYVKEGESVMFDASESSDPDGDALSFWWYLDSRPNDSKYELGMTKEKSARFEFKPDVPGTYGVMVGAMSGRTGPRSVPINYVVVGGSAPVAQINTVATTLTDSQVWLDGSRSSSSTGRLSYQWTLTAKPAQSQASLPSTNAAQMRLNVDVAGTYTVVLVVNDGHSLSKPATVSIRAIASEPQQPSRPTITLPTVPTLEGDEAVLSVSAADPGGLALTYQWRFADGSTASGASVRQRFANAGNQDIHVTATNTLGLSNSGSATLRVAKRHPGTVKTACSGSKCAAVSDTRYAGTGAGIWNLPNTGAVDLSVDVNIDNVAANRQVVLLMTNGSTDDYPTQPYFGSAPLAGTLATLRRTQAAQTATSVSQAVTNDAARNAHDKARQLNDALLADYVRSGQAPKNAQAIRKRLSAQSQVRQAPPLHSARSWNGALGEPAYQTTAEAVCRLPSGRNIVFWGDSNGIKSGALSTAVIDEFSRFFCGDDGAFVRLTALTGDVWGTHADANLINDTTLQDVNVVIGDPGSDTGWGGYYSFANSMTKAQYPNSNEALAFFLNSRLLPGSKLYLMSSLVHEAMHMANAYQRTVRNGWRHESWLEETTAMMAEDIVVPALLNDSAGRPYNDIANGRIPPYMSWSGSFGYIGPGWGGGTYAAGGSFGAFLTRRFGLDMFRRLLTQCTDGTGTQTSYQCADQAIKGLGGAGFADEFARMGAVLMTPLSLAEQPEGYGYPQMFAGNYLLTSFEPTKSPQWHLPNYTQYYQEFQRTSMAYITDGVPSGTTRYRRLGIVVPVGATLSVIIH